MSQAAVTVLVQIALATCHVYCSHPVVSALLCSVAEPQARRALSDRQTADLIRVAALPPERLLKSLQEIIRRQLSNLQLPLLQQWGVSVEPKPLEVGQVQPDCLCRVWHSICNLVLQSAYTAMVFCTLLCACS